MSYLLSDSVFFVFYSFCIVYFIIYSRRMLKPFLILAFIIGLRLILSSSYEITFSPFLAGMSLVALHTIVCLVFILKIVTLRVGLLKELSALFPYLFVLVFSATINMIFVISLSDIIKFSYLIALTYLLMSLISEYGVRMVFLSIVLLVIPLFFTQVLSIIAGHHSNLESDGSVSYVGTYFHEAAFSTVYVIGIFAAVIYSYFSSNRWPVLIIIFFLFGISFANYRTAILSALPLVIFYLYTGLKNKVGKAERISINSFFYIATPIFVILLLSSERFGDLINIFTEFDLYLLDPAYYERHTILMFSGRLNLWAHYYQEYINGTFLGLIFGAGPSYWTTWADKYAHNQFISVLYETGVIGIMSLLFIYIYPLIIKIKSYGLKNFLTLIRFGFFGFFLLSMGTMPLWSIEGCILYSMLFAMVATLKMIDRQNKELKI